MGNRHGIGKKRPRSLHGHFAPGLLLSARGRKQSDYLPRRILNPRHYHVLIDLFGRDNVFEVTREEMYWMSPNIFSIAPDVVVSEQNFKRLNRHMRDEWGITVEEIPYREISKMGGLLRCSTMPLIRD